MPGTPQKKKRAGHFAPSPEKEGGIPLHANDAILANASTGYLYEDPTLPKHKSASRRRPHATGPAAPFNFKAAAAGVTIIPEEELSAEWKELRKQGVSAGTKKGGGAPRAAAESKWLVHPFSDSSRLGG